MIRDILTGNPFFASCLAATVLMIGWRCYRRESGIRWQQVFFPPLWAVCSTFALGISALLLPVTLDRFLYAADGSFGFQAAFAGARLLLRNPWLLRICAVSYFNLPIAMTAMYLVLREHDRAQAGRFVRFSVWLGITGFALYFVCPAVGPGWAFAGDFPNRAPQASVAPVTMGLGARNCMPSLHTAWILCLLWSAPPLSRWWRAALWAFSGFTLLYTLSAGGHYLVDLIVAVPFTRAVQAAMNGHWRSVVLWCNGAAVLLWFLLLRFGLATLSSSRFVPWALTAVTLIGTAPAFWMLLRRAAVRRSELALAETSRA